VVVVLVGQEKPMADRLDDLYGWYLNKLADELEEEGEEQ
jgi:hypothetical protein